MNANEGLPIFVLDYHVLSGQEQEYLARFKNIFHIQSYSNIQDINLDSEQIGRLRQDQSVMLYKDSATVRGTTISIVSPIPNHPTQFWC